MGKRVCSNLTNDVIKFPQCFSYQVNQFLVVMNFWVVHLYLWIGFKLPKEISNLQFYCKKLHLNSRIVQHDKGAHFSFLLELHESSMLSIMYTILVSSPLDWNSDDEHDTWRCNSQTIHHSSQRPQHGPLLEGRSRTLP